MNKFNKATSLTLVLVFSAVFLVIIGSIVGLSTQQNRLNKQKIAKELALQISEAGINYAKWRLAHYPDDFSNEQRIYSDPQGQDLGVFDLEFTSKIYCGDVNSLIITSTAYTYDYPNTKRIISVKYSRPSIAEYAYLIDDNVWAGEDREISGRYHANGGIRMDGQTDSLVTSAKDEWNCTSSFGCSSPYEVKPGVFGDGGGQEQGLWQYPPEFPIEEVDFESISMNLSIMKELAQESGLYFRNPTAKGYHIIFKNDGTIDVWNVKTIDAIRAYNEEQGWHWSYEKIKNEKFDGNYSIPETCKLIFIEGDLWIEGTVNGKITITSADLINPNKNSDIYLNGNINYVNNSGLGVIAENNILVPLYSPDIMELSGIFLAQKGHFGRNHYPSYYWPWYDREKLEMHGSVISKGRVGTQWTSNGYFVSGYRNRENTYDRNLMTDPPPLTPSSDNEYMFVKWEEVE